MNANRSFRRAPLADRAFDQRVGGSAGWLVVLCAVLLSGCPTRRSVRSGVRLAKLQPEVSVYIDGHYVGKAAALVNRIIQLGPGRHLIELRMPGYYTRYRTVTVRRGKIVELNIVLRRKLRWKTLFEQSHPPPAEPTRRKTHPRKTHPRKTHPRPVGEREKDS